MMNPVLNCKFHLGIVLILAVCYTSVPYVINKCLLQPHVFNSFFIQKFRVRFIYECVLYSNKYGKCNLRNNDQSKNDIINEKSACFVACLKQ